MSRRILDTLRQNFRQALSQHLLDEADRILARLKKEDPLSVETRGLELEFLIESERLEEAGTLADQLCRLFPSSARILFLAGKLSYRRKKWDQSEARFRESEHIYSSSQTRYWLGKALTQSGRLDEAESLLLSIRDQNPWALLTLSWLYERKNDFAAALDAVDGFLEHHPGHAFAAERRVRIKARMLDPEALIEEAGTLADFGETLPGSIFPEFVRKLFDTGQTPRAREEINARLESMQPREAVEVAWICYRKQAYDLACTLFLLQLRANVFNFKYLAALESAAKKCNRLEQVLEAYRPLCSEAGHLYGRRRLLTRPKKR